MNFYQFLAVGTGGALGALSRFWVHRLLTAWHGAEGAWSTFGINVTGSLLLGLLAGWMTHRDETVALFWMLGFCGAFTTFSTFALDAVMLFRERGVVMAGSYLGLSVGLGIVAFLVGVVLSRGNLG